MNNIHYFNINIAVQYGIEEAILLQNISFWTQKYIANNEHFYDGLYWMYNSRSAWQKLFSYISENKLRRALDTLVKAGILTTGNYNASKYDHTKWYALTLQGLELCQFDTTKIDNSICYNLYISIGEFNQSIGYNNQSCLVDSTNPNITNNKHTNLKTSNNKLLECKNLNILFEHIKQVSNTKIQLTLDRKKDINNILALGYEIDQLKEAYSNFCNHPFVIKTGQQLKLSYFKRDIETFMFSKQIHNSPTTQEQLFDLTNKIYEGTL